MFIFSLDRIQFSRKICCQHVFLIWSAPKPFILQRSKAGINKHLIQTYKLGFWTIHLFIVWASYLPSRVTWQEKLQISAGLAANQYYLASVWCKSSGKPSTRFPLGRLVELKTSPGEKFLEFLTFHVFHIFFEKWAAQEIQILRGSMIDIHT